MIICMALPPRSPKLGYFVVDPVICAQLPINLLTFRSYESKSNETRNLVCFSTLIVLL